MKEKLMQLVDWAKRDKKQAGMVVGLLAVGLLLWGRLLLKQVPQTASADDEKPLWLQEAEADLLQRGAEKPVVTLEPIGEPSRDPFLLDANRYKRTLSEDSELNQAKLGHVLTDEQMRMAVVQAAEELRLQSITLGEVPAAFINDRLIRVGGSIDGFELLSCDERSAVLEKDGVRVRLGMGSTRNRNR